MTEKDPPPDSTRSQLSPETFIRVTEIAARRAGYPPGYGTEAAIEAIERSREADKKTTRLKE